MIAILSVIMNASRQPHLILTLELCIKKTENAEVVPFTAFFPESNLDPEFLCSSRYCILSSEYIMKEIDHVAVLSTLFSSLNHATVSVQITHLLLPLL